MGESTCKVQDCGNVVRARGWCASHYARWGRYGNPTHCPQREVQPLEGRFWPKVDASGDCWEWTAATNHLGYGQILVSGRTLGMAHRVAWELLVGPIAAGRELDHLCRNHGCVNPDHLEPVTHQENMRRAPRTAVQVKRARTHCPQGHPYDETNTYTRPSRPGGERACRTCKAAQRNVARNRRVREKRPDRPG